ncbi:hypothetical protein POR1_36 [Pseudomonas phage POR1]|uniref:Uncharacterized protein n=1 Tax=Pseudomonas phage POR1 TaxID=1718594 RepID=A0A0N7GFC7_9CAUD|nr:hypothetical protein POR1_36 [Pseudomonas phage POR1]
MYTTNDVLALLAEIESNDLQMNALKERNSEIRKSLGFAALGANWADAKGVQHVEVSGVPMKIEFGQNYTLDKKALPEVLAKMSEAGRAAAIKYKPELSLSGYKDLSASDRRALDKAVKTSPAPPKITRKV